MHLRHRWPGAECAPEFWGWMSKAQARLALTSMWSLGLLAVWRGKASLPLPAHTGLGPGATLGPLLSPTKADAGWTRRDHGSREACPFLAIGKLERKKFRVMLLPKTHRENNT